jgi:hypothetical protein
VSIFRLASGAGAQSRVISSSTSDIVTKETDMKIRIAVVVTGLVTGIAAAVGVAAPTTAGTTAAKASGGACAQLPHGSEKVHLDPRDFTIKIDNPYWPMRPGTTWKYVERGGGEKATVRVHVSHRTKMIKGIRVRIIHDVVRVDGEIIENTFDWFAQDSRGNIWYLGEFTREYENGQVVSTEGSWKHGRDGAQAGVVVPAKPQVGCSYREEFLKGEAEDRAKILSINEKIKTPTGFHRRVLQTANTTPLQANLLENKFYARGKGPVLELDISPQFGRAVLVKMFRN